MASHLSLALAVALLVGPLVACSSSPGKEAGNDSGTNDVTQAHDAGHPHDAGRPRDAAHVDAKDAAGDGTIHDAGVRDAFVDAGVGLTCGKLLGCDQPCTSTACTNGCYAKATGVAQGLFNGLNDCINLHCSADAGGPCSGDSSSTCSSCQTAAATGACISNLATCENDVTVAPPDPDGGGVVEIGRAHV